MWRRTSHANISTICIEQTPRFSGTSSAHLERRLERLKGRTSSNDWGPTTFRLQTGEANALAPEETLCERCLEPFLSAEDIVSYRNGLYHQKCFVCVQCFQPLSLAEFYEHEERRYCKYDFQMLFAPFCHKCGEFVMSRVIKVLGRSWHPECLLCDQCGAKLVVTGLHKFNGRPLCRACFNELAQVQSTGHLCQTCRTYVSKSEMIRYKGDLHHPHHFKCARCEVELGPDARERGGDLYCLQCFDKLGIPVCAACRRLVEGRIVWALGKPWHVEHFVCHQCEVPFMGGRYYELQGRAYCFPHYQARSGSTCHICCQPVMDILARFTNKAYCPGHFTCFICDRNLNEKSKLYEIDLKPACKECYDKLPTHWKKRLAKLHILEAHN
ncbi:hypothetical protein CRM22_004926 [Opisthorchis felineus]|uniref:LIM zinc-binding domain-containing protein n=1 Tax=Opisthorchis felineus TaxID=147828 RepID=A0A4S2M0I6_OPIFE|nr:hypothetical protein CRM22_004926 [Opisthorchis felineus]